MLLSDAVMGESYIVEKIHLPFETERRLEAQIGRAHV